MTNSPTGSPAALIAVLLCACSSPKASQVILVIDAEPGVRAASRSLVIRVLGGSRDRSQLVDEVYVEQLPVSPTSGWGIRIALAPDKQDWRRLYEAEAIAYDGPNGTGSVVARTRTVSGYVRHETRTLRLLLQDGCIGEECTPTTTCRAGSCVDPFIDPNMLEMLPDAGTMDASRPDTSGPCTDNMECDDGIPCTIDTCVAGLCHFTGNSGACDDENSCTTDRCRLGAGCENTPNDLNCDDGMFCNGNDQCGGGGCTLHEGVPCGSLTCDETLGACTGCSGDLDCADMNGRICSGGNCVCPGSSESCSNRMDDDCDGLIDCLDPDCAGMECSGSGEVCESESCLCLSTEMCGDGVTNDCDALVDEGCAPDVEGDCLNGADDDGDGAIDCADSDCGGQLCDTDGSICDASSIRCCDPALDGCGGGDEDCDGAIDEDCFTGTEICDNFMDDDGDTQVDCDDVDCEGQTCVFGSVCMGGTCSPDCEAEEFNCTDGLDNDCDGPTDCLDVDCCGYIGCATSPMCMDGGTDGGTDGGMDGGTTMDAGVDGGPVVVDTGVGV